MSKPKYSKLATEIEKQKFGEYLTEDEEMIIYTTVSKAYLLQKFIFHFFVSLSISFIIFFLLNLFFKYDLQLVMIAALLYAIIYACQRYYFTKEGIQYILTNSRVIVQIGYFNVTLYSANYNKITHIEVIQGFMDRLFYKHGQLIVRTSGINQTPITLDYLEYPIEFKNILERLITQERQRYGHVSV